MKHLLLVLFLALFAVRAGASPLDWLDTWQRLRAAHELPGLDARGVTLPQQLLLDQMKAGIDGPGQQVQSLTLHQGEGTLVIVAHQTVAVRVTAHFRVQAIDWPHRTVWLVCDERVESASTNLIGRVFGNLVITAFQAAAGKTAVAAALDGRPCFRVSGNRVAVLLDQVPQLKPLLATEVAGYPVFNRIGLKTLAIEDGQLRVALGLAS